MRHREKVRNRIGRPGGSAAPRTEVAIAGGIVPHRPPAAPKSRLTVPEPRHRGGSAYPRLRRVVLGLAVPWRRPHAPPAGPSLAGPPARAGRPRGSRAWVQRRGQKRPGWRAEMPPRRWSASMRRELRARLAAPTVSQTPLAATQHILPGWRRRGCPARRADGRTPRRQQPERSSPSQNLRCRLAAGAVAGAALPHRRSTGPRTTARRRMSGSRAIAPAAPSEADAAIAGLSSQRGVPCRPCRLDRCYRAP